MEVFGLGAAYNLQALYNIQIKKLHANRAVLTTLNCGNNAENIMNASAAVYDGLGYSRRLVRIKFSWSAHKKISSIYSSETK